MSQASLPLVLFAAAMAVTEIREPGIYFHPFSSEPDTAEAIPGTFLQVYKTRGGSIFATVLADNSDPATGCGRYPQNGSHFPIEGVQGPFYPLTFIRKPAALLPHPRCMMTHTCRIYARAKMRGEVQ